MSKFLEKNADIFELNLLEKVELTPDTTRFRFKLPNKNDVLGLPVGKHLSLIAETMPSQADDTLILLCGPPKMISEAVKPSLEELNYLKDNIFTF